MAPPRCSGLHIFEHCIFFTPEASEIVGAEIHHSIVMRKSRPFLASLPA